MALPFFRALNPVSKKSGIYIDRTQLSSTEQVEPVSKQSGSYFDKTQLSSTEQVEPVSKQSGSHFDKTKLSSTEQVEIVDKSLLENINSNFRKANTLFLAIRGTFHVISGTHYGLEYDEQNRHTNAKGLLDFTILPLISRKLIADTYCYERHDQTFINGLSWCLALPLELFRFSAAIALTLLLIPLIALGTMIRCCFEPGEASIKTSEVYKQYFSN